MVFECVHVCYLVLLTSNVKQRCVCAISLYIGIHHHSLSLNHQNTLVLQVLVLKQNIEQSHLACVPALSIV